MRILHILDHSIPLHSGYTFRTAALLREQRARGWETFHLTSPKQGLSDGLMEDVEGLKFFRTPATPNARRVPVVDELQLVHRLASRLREVALEVKPAILHAHSPVLNAMAALRVGRELDLPVVYEIRAFWEDAAVDHGTTREGSLRYRVTHALETRAIRRADHVFTICEGLRRDIVERGIPASKLTVVPNAVDVEAFQWSQPADPKLQQRWGLHGKTVIGFIGSFYAYEGLDLLVASLPQLLRQRPDVCLLLVGGGPQEQALKEQVRALGLEAHAVFTGRVPHAEVSRYYDLIDLLAYPRHSIRLTELVTPLKPLEAMAQGHVFVASDVGGHRELIQHGKTGWLFKADDVSALTTTLHDVLDHRERWPVVQRNGRQFVESVRNWRNSVANYDGVYQQLASHGKRS